MQFMATLIGTSLGSFKRIKSIQNRKCGRISSSFSSFCSFLYKKQKKRKEHFRVCVRATTRRPAKLLSFHNAAVTGFGRNTYFGLIFLFLSFVILNVSNEWETLTTWYFFFVFFFWCDLIRNKRWKRRNWTVCTVHCALQEGNRWKIAIDNNLLYGGTVHCANVLEKGTNRQLSSSRYIGKKIG